MLDLRLNSVLECLFDNIRIFGASVVSVSVNVVIDSEVAFVGLPVHVNPQVQQVDSPLQFLTPGIGHLVVDNVVIDKVVLEPGPVGCDLKGEWLNNNVDDLGVIKTNKSILIPSPCLLHSLFNVLNWQLISHL